MDNIAFLINAYMSQVSENLEKKEKGKSYLNCVEKQIERKKEHFTKVSKTARGY